MTEKSGQVEALAPDVEHWLHAYEQMFKIREFEEKVNELYMKAQMPGLAHLYSGQEAVAVGVCQALRREDYITSTHRGHGHCLAKGASVDRMFAELLGKEAGYCRGKGGSMHIADPDSGNLGANAIVGGSELPRVQLFQQSSAAAIRWRSVSLARVRWGRDCSMRS
jgi:pyruvate dehydrogenase E1 component alpha subunit